MEKMNVYPYEFDSRMIEWNLKHNIITPEQLKTHTKALVDDAEHAETLQIQDEDLTGN